MQLTADTWLGLALYIHWTGITCTERHLPSVDRNRRRHGRARPPEALLLPPARLGASAVGAIESSRTRGDFGDDNEPEFWRNDTEASYLPFRDSYNHSFALDSTDDEDKFHYVDDPHGLQRPSEQHVWSDKFDPRSVLGNKLNPVTETGSRDGTPRAVGDPRIDPDFIPPKQEDKFEPPTRALSSSQLMLLVAGLFFGVLILIGVCTYTRRRSKAALAEATSDPQEMVSLYTRDNPSQNPDVLCPRPLFPQAYPGQPVEALEHQPYVEKQYVLEFDVSYGIGKQHKGNTDCKMYNNTTVDEGTTNLNGRTTVEINN